MYIDLLYFMCVNISSVYIARHVKNLESVRGGAADKKKIHWYKPFVAKLDGYI